VIKDPSHGGPSPDLGATIFGVWPSLAHVPPSPGYHLYTYLTIELHKDLHGTADGGV
jgi:hypothetical protein